MLLVLFNPQTETFYLRMVSSISENYRVGYVNQYDHMIVAIYVIDEENRLKPVDDFWDYLKLDKEENTTFKNKVINRAIDLLYRLKK